MEEAATLFNLSMEWVMRKTPFGGGLTLGNLDVCQTRVCR